MRLPRRQLLHLGSAALILAPLSGRREEAAAAGSLKLHRISDAAAAPVLNEGDQVLVDTAFNSFQGEGIYLYPAWGQPRAYLVRASAARPGQLEFRNPGSGALLWIQSQSLGAGFAARVEARLGASALPVLPELASLTVPRLPLSA